MSRLVKASPLLLLIAYLGFISLGLPDALLGVAWPSIRGDFALSQAALGGILTASSVGYFLSSFSTGTLLRWLGVGRLLTASTLLVAIALLGYANAPIWGLFLLSALLVGLGSGAIDAGLNNYAATNFRPRHMNWLHACWGLGATMGPLLMTSLLRQGDSWRLGYLIVAAVLAAMATTFALTHRAWQSTVEGGESESALPVGIGEALRHPLVLLQMLLFFCYTGTEAAAGAWAFTLLSEGRGLSLSAAGLLTSVYWASLTVGRVAFGFIVEWLGSVRTLRTSLLGAVAGTLLLLLLRSPLASALGLITLGISLAPIFPGMLSETPRRLGSALAAQAVGFQVSAAVLGGAMLPSLIGLLITRTGSLEVAPVILAAGAVAMILLHELILRRTGDSHR